MAWPHVSFLSLLATAARPLHRAKGSFRLRRSSGRALSSISRSARYGACQTDMAAESNVLASCLPIAKGNRARRVAQRGHSTVLQLAATGSAELWHVQAAARPGRDVGTRIEPRAPTEPRSAGDTRPHACGEQWEWKGRNVQW